jgi:hypothetical protein
MRQRKEHEIKAAIYDEFNEYVERTLRDSDNPHITLKEFEQMPKSGLTHMELVLENVKTGTGRLFKKVEEFKDGSILKTRESVKDGAPVFVAYIPFKEKESKTHSSSSGSVSRSSKPPSQTTLLLYFVALFSTIIVGLVKTTAADWQYFLK